jgi:hypothetical protein
MTLQLIGIDLAKMESVIKSGGGVISGRGGVRSSTKRHHLSVFNSFPAEALHELLSLKVPYISKEALQSVGRNFIAHTSYLTLHNVLAKSAARSRASFRPYWRISMYYP